MVPLGSMQRHAILPTPLLASASLSDDCHGYRACHDQGKAGERALRIGLMEDGGRECHCDDDRELVDRHDDRDDAGLDCIVVAEPGGAGRKAGGADEAELALLDVAHFAELSLHGNDDPCHDQYIAGADGCGEVRLDAFDADLRKNGCEGCKDSRSHGVPDPGIAFDSVVLLLALDHEEGAYQNAGRAYELHGEGIGLAEEDDSKKDGKDSRALVDRHDLVDITHGKRFEVADPGGTCRHSRKCKEEHRVGRDGSDRRDGADERCHEPGKEKHDDRAHGGGDVRVRMADAALGEDGSDAGKECRCAGCKDPHGRFLPVDLLLGTIIIIDPEGRMGSVFLEDIAETAAISWTGFCLVSVSFG